MSLISRIEISNCLTEGLNSNHYADWNPMLSGITLRMDCQSSLVNLTNGAGKTTVCEFLLYVLSRDKTLLMRLREKAAPNGRGFSHARIEFRTTEESVFREPSLLEVDVNNIGGSTHVVGVAINNDPAVSPIFYGYSGTLEDSPCYTKSNGLLAAVPDAEFVRRTKAMPRCKWDSFANIREWHDYVGLFVSMDVVRRNASYQAKGSDDKNASFFSCKPKNGESYDSAFFKAVVAPDLLTNLLNSFAEEGESTVEDTLHLSLSQIVNSEREIAKKQANLELRQTAIETDLKPVVDAGVTANTLHEAMQRALRAVKKDVALLHHFGAQKSPQALAGLPRALSSLVRAADQDPRIQRALRGMVISRDDGIVLVDKTLGELAGVEVRVLGQFADRKRIPHSTLNSQVIDFACDFGFSTSGAVGGGHYRKGYSLAAIEQLLPLLEGTQGATLTGLQDVFTAAFNIARTQIDTNPASLQIYTLNATLQANDRALTTLEAKAVQLSLDIKGMETQIKGREENEAAWQSFTQIAQHLPEELRSTPKQAHDWLLDRSAAIQVELADMHRRNGELSKGWTQYLGALDAAGLEGIEGIQSRYDKLNAESKEIAKNLKTDRNLVADLKGKAPALERAKDKAQGLFDGCAEALARLDALKASYKMFQGFFGAVDPTSIEHPLTTEKKAAKTLSAANEVLRSTTAEWESLAALKAGSSRFDEIFGAATDPFQCDPLKEHRQMSDQAHLAQQGMQPLEPLVTALESFEALYAGQTPTQWLHATDDQRASLGEEQRQTGLALIGAQEEIKALDALSVVDDASFARAWELLGDGDDPQRLYSVIKGLYLPLQARSAALIALSGLLSAPVFSTIEALQAASSLLERHGVSIPMLLKEPLLQAVQAQEESPGELRMLGFIAGRYSRKVRILLEPQYAQSERALLVNKVADLTAQAERIKADLLKVDFRSPQYVLAQQADEALRTNSVSRYKAHEAELAQASAALSRLTPQIRNDALDCLRDRRSFLQKGGSERLKCLWDEIEVVKANITVLHKEHVEAERRASPESVIAYLDAIRYVQAGADLAHEAAQGKLAEASNGLDGATLVFGRNQSDLLAAQNNLDTSEAKEAEFLEEDRPTQLDEMRAVLAFSVDGENIEFMQGFARQCGLKSSEAKRLTGFQSAVNFERAGAYVANLGKSQVDLVRSIASTQTTLNEVNGSILGLKDHNRRIRDFELPNWQKLRKAVHELTYELGSQAAKTAKAHEHFDSLEEGAAPAESHPLYGDLAALGQSLRKATIEQTDTLSATLAQAVFKLQELNPRDAIDAFETKRRDVNAALVGFTKLKDGFCASARLHSNTQLAAFNVMELAAIERATPASIADLRALFEELAHSLKKDRLDADKAIQAAHSANEEAVKQLSSLIHVAEENLDALKRVMNRYQNGCFKIKVQLASGSLIQEILLELTEKIKAATPANDDAQRTIRRSDETRIKELLRVTLIDKVFLEPKVTFIHGGIRKKESPVTDQLSTGQKVALEFMWIVRQAEYEIERGLRELSSKQAAQARVKSNRVIFVDGIFSTLSDRDIIREAFSGLGNLGGNFQIIGFLHSPTWTNDSSVFPVYHVGRKMTNRVSGSSLVSFDAPGRGEGTLGFLTTITQAHPDGLRP